MTDRIRALVGAHQTRRPLLSTVSGVASTKKEMIRWFDRSTSIDVITTKSFQVTPNPGNREPVICEVAPGDFGNSVGLRNPGMEVALPELEKLRSEGLGKLLNVSVSASNVDDFVTLVKAFDHVADSIELNFSCPHAKAGFGASIGSDCAIAASYVKGIRQAYPEQKSALLVKLTPNVDDIASIARGCIDAGADGIVAINTVGPRLYTEKHSGEPILNNALGGKGGASGAWIKRKALECVSAIRREIGDGPLVIGMGGVQDADDVKAMIEAGADVVGIGSVFGTIRQQDWPGYLDALKRECGALFEGKEIAGDARRLISGVNRMEYTPHVITRLVEHTPEMLIMELDGSLDCHSGEFAFLFVPGLGEKPFSVAHNDPLTFLIRRRGFFTTSLFSLKVGDTVYVRGLYGKPLEAPSSRNALLLAGGSGVAVLPSLCRMLEPSHAHVDVLVGTSASSVTGLDGKALFEDWFRQHADSYQAIADDGKVGRVLDHLAEHVEGKDDLKAYLVGPEKFMAIAAARLVELGLSRDDIFLSLERSTLCGIGLCGECVCGDRLTCQWGTFQNYGYIMDNARELLE